MAAPAIRDVLRLIGERKFDLVVANEARAMAVAAHGMLVTVASSATGMIIGSALWFVFDRPIAVAQRLANLSPLLDPAFAVVFLLLWWSLNRAEIAKPPIPGRCRGTAEVRP